MAQLAALERLPSELLLSIVDHLRARKPTDLACLRNLCLVSKTLLPIAQEMLYANAVLPASCNCHPTVNSALQLLRTLLERPKLAAHVKALRLVVVRRNVSKLYETEFPKKHLDLAALRELSYRKLTSLGYSPEHPWWSSLKNSLESAYAGLLLCMLPNLEALQYEIKELHRGFAVLDSTAALFGTNSPPAALGVATSLHTLCMSDLAFLRSTAFEKLRSLKITSLTVSTLLQLNGPNTFRGTNQLAELSVGLSVFLMDKACVDDMTVSLCDLIDALGCHSLSTLKIKLEHETYCAFHTPPTFDVQFFMDQLSRLHPTLRILEIELDPQEDPEEWEFILDHCQNPIASLTDFTKLEHLKIPQDFLFSIDGDDPQNLLPQDLPRSLRTLDIVCPTHHVTSWLKHITSVSIGMSFDSHDLRKIVLHCRNDVRTAATIFTKKVKPVFNELFNGAHNIASYVYEFDSRTTKDLTTLFVEDPGESDDDGWEDEVRDDTDDNYNHDEHEDDEDENYGDYDEELGLEEDEFDGGYTNSHDGSETDEDMPDLEYFDHPGTLGMLIEDMD